MRIDQGLAEFIARSALTEPYRQVDALSTGQIGRWLKQRALDLSPYSIHYLWLAGVLHPIAVFESALGEEGLDRERFVEIDLDYDDRTFIDLGTEVGDLPPGWSPGKPPGGLSDSLIWHPFQLWSFVTVARALSTHIALEAPLAGADAYASLARQFGGEPLVHLAEFANADRHLSFLRVLGLLLAAEPLVHTAVNRNLTTHPTLRETYQGYFEWRNTYDGGALLSQVGLACDEVEQWQRDIAILALMADPLEHWRILVRHASREKRSRLKGVALQADSLYDAAEALRRYLEMFHGRELVEEDDAMHGPAGAAVKERLYGTKRTADFERAVFRRVVRDFDLDPQARTTWFVEGDTEEAFIEQMGHRMQIELDRAGLTIMNLKGLGGLDSERFRSVLTRLQREEVFTYVSIDLDRLPGNLGILQHYSRRKLLPAGFRIWDPDFEGENFTLDELAVAAMDMARAGGVEMQISAEDISNEMTSSGKGAGKAVESLWRRGRFNRGKGKNWGTHLADMAAARDCPDELADSDGRRPIAGRLFFLLRGQRSNYQATIQGSTVDDQGNV